ncbi:MAG: mandelate racemase/muconate lactonizing enzyme family protein [Bryobacteraceae bacterium]|nr:mandelate racemase/muconate lactonizing enzyme family protein [Bryobacteraceae bacterium]
MRISRIEAIPIRYPRDRDRAERTAGSPTTLAAGQAMYRWSTTVPALYSTHFETALIRLETDTGLVGWGEAQAPLAPEVACTIVDLLLRPVVEGAEFDGSRAAIEALWDSMYRTMRVRGQTGGFMLDAISGVDIALWDLAGKMAGKPVSALLSDSPRASIPAYLSGVADALATAPFAACKLFHHGSVSELLATFDAVRENRGPEMRIAVDALWRLDLAEAQALTAALEERGGALWLEAPLFPELTADHIALAHSTRTPLALGESYRTRFELGPYFEARALAWVQPDLGRSGITESVRIAACAAAAGARVAPHLSIAMGPQIAAAIHFAAATPGCELLEFNPNVLETANAYLASPLVMRDGAWVVPTAPGLGVEPVLR